MTQQELDALVARLPLYSQWLHQNGETYVIMGLSNLDLDRQDKYPLTVIYFPMSQPDKGLTKPAVDWHRSRTFIKKLTDEEYGLRRAMVRAFRESIIAALGTVRG